jgi:hypothetical protein
MVNIVEGGDIRSLTNVEDLHFEDEEESGHGLAQIEFAKHLAQIECFKSNMKWVQGERCACKTRLP